MRRVVSGRTLLLIALAVICSGCLGGKKTMEMTVRGDANMNNGGNAAVVRIYQLTGDSNFMRTSIESFWENDEQALGDELIGPKEEILLYPNEERAIELEISDETRYVGIAADLRAPDPLQWRRVFNADELRGKQIAVTVNEDRLNVSY